MACIAIAISSCTDCGDLQYQSVLLRFLTNDCIGRIEKHCGAGRYRCACNLYTQELRQLTGFCSAGAYLLQAALQANPHPLSDTSKDGCIKQLLHSCHSLEAPLHQSGCVSLDGVMPHSLHVSCRSCLLYTSPSPRDRQKSRMPSSA